ncbi:MAG: prepilin peptidase, partial [Ardenticatenia bacterium]|nr:prepilin peptidase [Ardenticatenia bacterium]
MSFEIIGHIARPLFPPLALIALLIVAAAQDLQAREVSGWLTLPPLLATVAWRAATGGWVLLAAFAVIALFSERIVCRGRGPALAALMAGLVAVSCFLPGSPTYWTLLGWLAAWLLWEFNVIGGADVKLMMLLVTVYPYPSMFFLILLAKLVAGLIVPAALYGRNVAKRLLSIAFLVLVARQMPDRETLEREGLPAVFVYTMAG